MNSFFRNNGEDISSLLKRTLDVFFTPDWIEFLEQKLNTKVFLGTSHRYLVKDKNAAQLLKNWKQRLMNQGVQFHLQNELLDFEINKNDKSFELCFKDKDTNLNNYHFDYIFMGLGGGSWEKEAVSWPQLFRKKQIAFADFEELS